ncbi:MAG: ABC transporter permease [Rhodospirillaceae bacterium]|nr:MAG: ABC transporter permease [Rhodospirillaceae bacterium]
MSAPPRRFVGFGNVLLPILFGIALLAMWEWAVRHYGVPEYVVPGPVAIARAFSRDGADLLAGLMVTLQVTVAALVLAAITGAVFAFALAQSRLVEQTLFPYAVFLQVTPIVTIAPFIIIWVSNVFVVLLILAWMAAVFPVISNTLLGLKSADPNLKDLFQLYRANRWQTATKLLLPSALPHFLGGLRISGGLALIGTVVAEMVAGTSGTRSGLASRLLEASYRLELARAMACFVLLSATGLVLYVVLDTLSHYLLRHWHESARPKDG